MSDDKFPTNQLQDRYGINRSVVYNRLEALQLKPQRDGNRAFISGEQLQLMDDFDAHLKAKGRTNEFVQRCIEEGRIVPTQRNTTLFQTESQMMSALGLHQDLPMSGNFQATPAPGVQEAIEQLLIQMDVRVNAEDLQGTRERAQYRAAAKVMGEETLTLLYEATEAFTILGLKEQVEQHRLKIHQIRARRTVGMGNNLNDFLSNSLLVQMATGRNGSLPSTSGSSITQGESNTSSN